jgi:hypothetical protein
VGTAGLTGWGVVVCLALAGCGSAGSASGPSPDGPSVTGTAVASPAAAEPDLTAEVVQYRRDAQRDVVQVKVTNHGDVPVQVDRVELATTTFVAPVAEDKDSLVGPGLSVDLTVPLGEAACDADEGAATDPADHTATLVVDGTDLTLPVDDVVLQEVRSQRCALAAVGEVVTFAWEPVWSDGGVVRGEPALVGTLVATPAGDGTSVVSVSGATTLFTIAEPVQATLEDDPVDLAVLTTVTRCDPHSVAEDKKGYLFPVAVQVPGSEPVLVEVAVPVPERVALQDLIERTCY